MRTFRRFSYKDTNLRVFSRYFDDVCNEVVTHRKLLEKYIRQDPAFAASLSPVALREGAPVAARRMAAAACKTGLGPMASVAGALAQLGVEKALALGDTDAIVENGGDMYIASTLPVVIGIHSGDEKFGSSLAFDVPASRVAICSSSGRMGHSMSMGNCSLATAISDDAALADSAATLLGNLISTQSDIERAISHVTAISGIRGAMAIIDGRIGLGGQLPPIVKNTDDAIAKKVTRDRYSI